MREARAIERVWHGRGLIPALTRTALAPLEVLYRGITSVRGALYDRGVLRAHELGLPAVSVGNLSVGGTGKTPVAAWIAGELVRRGATPAILLRGYGADESLVHAALNPGMRVIASADRVRGAERARAAGADVLVLDDAFQHRRARRRADVVLISADAWDGRHRLLPAGPWREPLSALARATLVVVTRKAATAEDSAAVVAAIAAAVRGSTIARVYLAPADLCVPGNTSRRSFATLRDTTVLAVSAIGDPHAFARQLTAAGARVTPAIFPDHHAFTRADAEQLARRAAGMQLVVCTLKDAVKLSSLWPREAPPLWYVSQLVVVERGEREIAGLLDDVVRARPNMSNFAGASRPQ